MTLRNPISGSPIDCRRKYRTLLFSIRFCELFCEGSFETEVLLWHFLIQFLENVTKRVLKKHFFIKNFKQRNTHSLALISGFILCAEKSESVFPTVVRFWRGMSSHFEKLFISILKNRLLTSVQSTL